MVVNEESGVDDAGFRMINSCASGGQALPRSDRRQSPLLQQTRRGLWYSRMRHTAANIEKATLKILVWWWTTGRGSPPDFDIGRAAVAIERP